MSPQYNTFARKVLVPFFRSRIGKVYGSEWIPFNTPFIFASNHTVSFDHAVLASYLVSFVKKKIYFPTKHTYYDFYGERISRMLGMVRVDKEEPARCIPQLLDKLRKGHCVGIFPEGVGHSGKKLKRGKTGVARLALASRARVLPVGVNGGGYSVHLVDWIRFFIDRRKNITIRFGKPLSFEEYYHKPVTYDALRSITDRIMSEISTLCGKVYEG